MLEALQNNVYYFSALKTHAQLTEVSSMLLTKEGKVRDFNSFSREVEMLNKNYNKNYLDSEYNFAISSSQMAAKWKNLDTTGRYNLQYRTAGDDRVRDSHRKLANITLPMDDPFWQQYYTPNGWKCRCTTIEVLKGKYEVSNNKEALQAGEAATTQLDNEGNNKLAIFRYNPGIQQVIYPPTHPYTKIAGAKEVLKNLK